MTAIWKPGETFKSNRYALYDELRDADGLLLGWIEQFTGQDEPPQFKGDSGDACYAWARPQNQTEPLNVPSMEVEDSIFKRLGCMQDVPTAKRRVEIAAGVRPELRCREGGE
jgi:hypothetical protein